MTIGIVQSVRELIGNMESDNVSDDDIEEGLDYGRSEVYAATLNDWNVEDTDHPLFNKAQQIIHYFASYSILDRFSGNFEKANVHYLRAKELTEILKTQYDEYLLVTGDGGSGGGGGGSGSSRFSVVIADYKSFPLNPDEDVYRSPTIIPGD